MRGTIVSFLAERLRTLPETRRELLRDLLLSLFHHSLLPRHDTSYDSYEPDRISVPARHAAYSANLVLLAVLTAGEITEQQLFPGRTDPVQDWRRLALLWRSQLPDEGWANLIRALVLHRGWDGDRRILRLRLHDAAEQLTPNFDPYWTYNFSPENRYRKGNGKFSWIKEHPETFRKQSNFLCDTKDDGVAHALEPFSGDLGIMITTFHDYWRGHPVSAANALITLWLTASQEKSPEELAVAYDACLLIAVNGFAPYFILDPAPPWAAIKVGEASPGASLKPVILKLSWPTPVMGHGRHSEPIGCSWVPAGAIRNRMAILLEARVVGGAGGGVWLSCEGVSGGSCGCDQPSRVNHHRARQYTGVSSICVHRVEVISAWAWLRVPRRGGWGS
ncbi:MAG: hypothetical protein ACRDR6_21385 [Pseudonocardiaceae bacterium]